MTLIACLLGADPAAAQTGAAGADPPHVVEARALFDEGAKLAEVGRYDDALSSFGRSHALRPHAVTTYNMATCERALSRYTRARKLFLKALAENEGRGGKELTREHLDAAQQSLADLEQRIARVAVTVEAPDVAVAIDGRPLEVVVASGAAPTLVAGTRDPSRGEAPPAARFELLADQGTHVVVLSREGYVDAVLTEAFEPRARRALALRAPTQRKLAPAPRNERTLEEITLLYGTTIVWGIGFGFTLGSNIQTTTASKAAIIVASSLGVSAAGAGTVFLLDRGEHLRYGAAQSIATGLIVGLEAGLFTGFSILRPGESHFDNAIAGGMMWGTSALGGAVGYVLGQRIGTTPRNASFVLSGALWGGSLGGFFSGGLAGIRGGSESLKSGLAVGGLLGTAVGAMGAGAFADKLPFPALRIRFIDLAGLGGGLLGWGLSTAALSRSVNDLVPRSLADLTSSSPLILIGTGIGIGVGLSLGVVLTGGMKNEDEANRCAATLPSWRMVASPAPGGATMGAAGVF